MAKHRARQFYAASINSPTSEITLGPRGRNVVLDKIWQPDDHEDRVTVAKD